MAAKVKKADAEEPDAEADGAAKPKKKLPLKISY